jgi:hypothetical protein
MMDLNEAKQELKEERTAALDKALKASSSPQTRLIQNARAGAFEYALSVLDELDEPQPAPADATGWLAKAEAAGYNDFGREARTYAAIVQAQEARLTRIAAEKQMALIELLSRSIVTEEVTGELVAEIKVNDTELAERIGNIEADYVKHSQLQDLALLVKGVDKDVLSKIDALEMVIESILRNS